MGQLRFGWLMGDEDFIEQAKRIFMTFSGIMGSPSVRIGTEIPEPPLCCRLSNPRLQRKELPYLRKCFTD